MNHIGKIMALMWIGGACMGAGTAMKMVTASYINGCMEANASMPHSEVRKYCEDKLEAVRLPSKE